MESGTEIWQRLGASLRSLWSDFGWGGLLTILLGGVVTFLIVRWSLLQQSRWRKEDQEARFKEVLWKAYEQLRNAMDDAQRRNRVTELVQAQALLSNPLFKMQPPDVQSAAKALYEICLDWKQRGPDYWSSPGGENGIKVFEGWLKAYKSLQVMQGTLSQLKSDSEKQLPKLHKTHVQSVLRSLDRMPAERKNYALGVLKDLRELRAVVD